MSYAEFERRLREGKPAAESPTAGEIHPLHRDVDLAILLLLVWTGAALCWQYATWVPGWFIVTPFILWLSALALAVWGLLLALVRGHS